jgi:formylglycine-generating enzyme required for sulfatase activity
VLKAFDDKLQRVVAIKVMAPELAVTSPARKRFLREAQSSAAIRHEHVVSVYAVEEKPLPYLVMEYIPGQTLQQRLDELGPLDLAGVLNIGRQIAEGLAAAHAMGLIHRDIKPGNILLDTSTCDRVKITDFGLARAADDASLTRSGIIAGTPMYMAPEQALGDRLDQRADLFSFGSVLYQMVTGRPPFRASATLAVLKRVAEDTPRPIREIIPETPHWLCDIIARLHAKDPNERFQSAREVADLLATCEAKLKAHEEVKLLAALGPKPSVLSGQSRWMSAALLLLPVIILGLTEMIGITHLLRDRRTPPASAGAGNNPPAVDASRTPPPLAVAPFDSGRAKEHQEAWAAYLAVPVESANSLGMKLVLIPPGRFLMGTPEDEPGRKPDEGPRHEVVITEPFLLGSHEVTVGQFSMFVKATNFVTETEKLGGPMIWDFGEARHRREPAMDWKNPGYEQTDNHPVVCVTWNDVQAFCQWLGDKEGLAYAVPTEAQWEYACRAGTTTAYCCGEQEDQLDAYSWYFPNFEGMSHAIGQKRANAWGLYDMHGNAWEWNADLFQADSYGTSPKLGPTAAESGARAMRGGCRVDGWVELRSGNRGRLTQDLGNDVVGFRVVQRIETTAVAAPAAEGNLERK